MTVEFRFTGAEIVRTCPNCAMALTESTASAPFFASRVDTGLVLPMKEISHAGDLARFDEPRPYRHAPL